MKIFGHIGFRKGSKGVLNKNTRNFCGKPLFEWSLDQLKNIKGIEGFCVSTDDKKAYERCLELGAIDIGLRSKSLSNDTSAKFSVWQDSAKKINSHGISFDALLDLDCTAPLRQSSDIYNAIDAFKSSSSDVVMSICEARKNPYFNIMEEDADGFLKISKGDGKIFSRQTAPNVYEHASSTYIIARTFLEEGNYLYDARIKGFMMPFKRTIDIDTELDWDIASFLFSQSSNLS
jgi:CMP-N,N'-diacetyllegionaminic acid synthase